MKRFLLVTFSMIAISAMIFTVAVAGNPFGNVTSTVYGDNNLGFSI